MRVVYVSFSFLDNSGTKTQYWLLHPLTLGLYSEGEGETRATRLIRHVLAQYFPDDSAAE